MTRPFGIPPGLLDSDNAEIKRLRAEIATHDQIIASWKLEEAQWLAENERLTRERDEWAAKWHAMRKLYAELRYPGMTEMIRFKGERGECNVCGFVFHDCHCFVNGVAE